MLILITLLLLVAAVAAFLFTFFTIQFMHDNWREMNHDKRKASLYLSVFSFIGVIVVSSLFLGSMYLVFHPTILQTYEKTESRSYDKYDTETVKRCDKILFYIDDFCVVYKVTTIPKTVTVEYGEPTTRIINNK